VVFLFTLKDLPLSKHRMKKTSSEFDCLYRVKKVQKKEEQRFTRNTARTAIIEPPAKMSEIPSLGRAHNEN